MAGSVKRRLIPLRAAIFAVLVTGVGTLALSAPPAEDATTLVAMLYRAQSGHREAAAALERVLRDANVRCIRVELPARSDQAAEDLALRELVEARPTVVAAGGTKATSLALRRLPNTPVVFFMVPNALDAPFMKPGSHLRTRVAGVTTDIAPDRQIHWLAGLVPKAKTVGLLSSQRTRYTAAMLQTAGAKYSVTVVPIEASKTEFMPAIEALNAYGCDAALMIADAQVYNSVSVQRLLLWGMRQRKTVSAFSPHVVKAGALMGQYCDNAAIGRQTARMILEILSGAEIASLGLKYPDRVEAAVNERTAEIIGITLDRARLPQNTVRFGNNK